MLNLLVDDKPTCQAEINDQMKLRLRCECMENYALDAWTGIKCKMTSDHRHAMLSVCAPLECHVWRRSDQGGLIGYIKMPSRVLVWLVQCQSAMCKGGQGGLIGYVMMPLRVFMCTVTIGAMSEYHIVWGPRGGLIHPPAPKLRILLSSYDTRETKKSFLKHFRWNIRGPRNPPKPQHKI